MGFGLVTAQVHRELKSFAVSEHAIVLSDLPVALDGFTIALLSDIHTGSPFNDLTRLGRIVEATNAAKPDLVLLAGDFVIQGVLGGGFTSPDSIADVLAALYASSGVYAVLGNHDWWFHAHQVRAALEQVGIPVLDDSAVSIEHNGDELWVAGVSDLWEGAHDIQGALRAVPDSSPVFVFTHNPDVFPEVPKRVVITLAGHTHGGQVALPLLGRPIVPSRFGQRYAIGHVREDGKHLFVTPGIGTSILPIRFGVPAEVSILRLRSKP